MNTYYRKIVTIILISTSTSLQSWEVSWARLKNFFGAQIEKTEQYNYTLTQDGSLSLINSCGPITILGWRQQTIELNVIMRGPAQFVNETKIHVDATINHLDVTAEIPSQAGDSVTIEYQLMVPFYLNIERVTTKRGGIKIKHVEGTITASTQEQGLIEIIGSCKSIIAQSAHNLKIKQVELPETATLVLEANGQLDIALPRDAHAYLHATTGKGRIETQQLITFDMLTMALNEKNIRKYLMTDVTATLGNGGASIMLKSRKGNIRITEEH